MDSLTKTVLWTSCAALTLWASPAAANDTAFGGTAAGPYPIHSTAVEMAGEQVELKLVGLDRWEVHCRFVFRNATDRPVSLRMGFPFPAHEAEGNLAVPRGLEAPKVGQPVVWRFRAQVRGKPVQTSLRRLTSGPLKERFGAAWAHVWPVRLGPREKVEVDNRYVLGVTETSMAFFTEVRYLLRTGANWRGGRIGRSQLTVTADQPFLPCTKRALRASWLGHTFDRSTMLAGFAAPARPPGFKVRREGGAATRIEWDLKHFKPRTDLRACIVPAGMHIRWLDLQLDSLDENKLSPAQLRLLINYHYAKHGRPFKSADLRRFFGKRWWYRPDPEFKSSRLTRGDRARVKHLKAVLEHKRSATGRPR